MTSSGSSSVFAGFRFPLDAISVAVRWYLRYVWGARSLLAPVTLCVPKTSSTSCDQAVLVDQASGGAGLPSDAVPVEIDRFG